MAACAAAVVLAACGGSDADDRDRRAAVIAVTDFADRPPATVAAAAASAMKGVSAFRVVGDVEVDGQTVGLDVAGNTDGDCQGAVTASGQRIELLGVDGTLWAKMRPATLSRLVPGLTKDAHDLIAGKWVTSPGLEDSLRTVCDIEQMRDQLVRDLSDASTFSTSGTGRVRGDDVVKLHLLAPGNADEIAYVLIDQPHYVVKVEQRAGEDVNTATFSEFNRHVDVDAPAADDQVDLGRVAA